MASVLKGWLAACILLSVLSLHAAQPGLKVFHIGHSLTDTPLPDYLQEAANLAGYTHSYNWQIRWGASCMDNWQNHASPAKGVDAWTALPDGTYNALILCTGTPVLEPYFSDNDPTYGGYWQELALTGKALDSATQLGPGNTNIKTYVYHFWHAINLQPAAWFDYNVRALAQIEQMADTMSANNNGKPVFIVPVASAFNELFAKVAAGQVPGITDRAQFFSDPGDPLHVNAWGKYQAALVHFVALYGLNPHGQTGGPTDLSQAVKTIMQDIAWRVVTAYPRSGVTPIPAAPLINFQTGDVTYFVTQQAALLVVADGYPAPTYRWQKNNTDIPNATGRTCTFMPALADSSAVYHCIVSNSQGTLTTSDLTLTVTPIPPLVYISDLPEASVTYVGYGGLIKDLSVGESPITLNGTTYTKGICAHAPSEVIYNLNGNYTTFQSDIGISDEGAGGSAAFQVLADGDSLYQSATLSCGAPHASLSVDVSGKNQLTLVASGSGHSVWANARLTAAVHGDPPVVDASALTATVGADFIYQITASNDPDSYDATGLPGGLSVVKKTGVISGAPLAAGTSTVTLSATNGNGTGTAIVTLTVSDSHPAAITSPLIATAVAGAPFSYTITATGAPAPDFDATSLPPGLALTDALISGTPTTPGSFAAALSAHNGIGSADQKTLAITVADPAVNGDSDGDGFPDPLEMLIGTSPLSSASTPYGILPATPYSPLVAPKAQIKLNFAAKIPSDTLTLTGTLAVPQGFIPKDEYVAFDFGGVAARFTLPAHGAAKSGNFTFTLAARTKHGAVFTQQAKYTLKLSKGSVAATLAHQGLDRAPSQHGVQKQIPLLILFHGGRFQATVTVKYSTNKAGTIGTAK